MDKKEFREQLNRLDAKIKESSGNDTMVSNTKSSFIEILFSGVRLYVIKRILTYFALSLVVAIIFSCIDNGHIFPPLEYDKGFMDGVNSSATRFFILVIVLGGTFFSSFFFILKGCICHKCYRKIPFINEDNYVFVCPFCNKENSNFLLPCSGCYSFIQHIKCPHCDGFLDTIADYNKSYLESKRYE